MSSCCAGLNVHAHDDRLVHFAADGRDDLRVLQIQLRLLEGGAFLLHVGDRGARAGAASTKPAAGRFRADCWLASDCARRLRACSTVCSAVASLSRAAATEAVLAFAAGHRLIVNLRGDFLLVHQRFVAAEVVLRLHVVRFGGFQLRRGRRQLAFRRRRLPRPHLPRPTRQI